MYTAKLFISVYYAWMQEPIKILLLGQQFIFPPRWLFFLISYMFIFTLAIGLSYKS